MPVGRAGSKTEGVAERFADPAVHKRIAGDLALIPSDDAWLRDAAQPSRARWEKKHDKGPAVTVLAQQWARAVYDRLHRQVAFERETCCQRYGRGADEPGAHWTTRGGPCLRRHGCMPGVRERQDASRSPDPQPCTFAWPSALAPVCRGARRPRLAGAAPHSPEPGSHGTTRCVAPALGRGREEGTEKVLGRSARTDHALPSAPGRREHRKTCVVQPRTVCAVIRQSSPHTRPSADCARNLGGKKQKICSQDQFAS
jgi:hypothetical protein